MTQRDIEDLILGRLLRLMRLRRGWLQDHVASRLRVSKATISRAESGLRALKPEELQKLCALHGSTMGTLYDFVTDAFLRAQHAVQAALTTKPGAEDEGQALLIDEPAWWEVATRATGSIGLLHIIDFSISAAYQPWPSVQDALVTEGTEA